MNTKYIVIRTENGHEMLFTFPEVVAHSRMFEVVQIIRHGSGNWSRPYMTAECVAAGFVSPNGNCYGRSESLDIASRPEIDTKLLNVGVADTAVIDMVLHCPKCGMQHVDAPEDLVAWVGQKTWDNPPHRSHLCHGCGHIWRPADVPTNGVAAIKTKGKNDSASSKQGVTL